MLHAQWSIRAADARRHVLCEKPLAISAAEARAMFAAAERHRVHLVEAFPYRGRLDPLLSGGALMDTGSYTVNFVRRSLEACRRAARTRSFRTLNPGA